MKKCKKYIVLLIFIFIFIITVNQAAALTCEEKYPNDGYCQEYCESEKFDNVDEEAGLCPGANEVCCHQYTQLLEYELEEPIFGFSTASGIADYVIAIFNLGIAAIIPITIIVIMSAGVQWILAGGNVPKIKKAQKRISMAVIGLTLALLTYTVLSFLNLTDPQNPRVHQIKPEVIETEDIPIITSSTEGIADDCPSASELVNISTGSGIRISSVCSDPRLLSQTNAVLRQAGIKAAAQGCYLNVTSAFRTKSKQEQLHDKYTDCLSSEEGDCVEAASPNCASPHLTGGAVDVGLICGDLKCNPIRHCPDTQLKSKLQDIMNSAGFARYKNEWWHFEYGTARWERCPGGSC